MVTLEPMTSAAFGRWRADVVRDYDAIGLHVFGDNDVARGLYRSSGYVETDVSMRKTLR